MADLPVLSKRRWLNPTYNRCRSFCSYFSSLNLFTCLALRTGSTQRPEPPAEYLHFKRSFEPKPFEDQSGIVRAFYLRCSSQVTDREVNFRVVGNRKVMVCWRRMVAIPDGLRVTIKAWIKWKIVLRCCGFFKWGPFLDRVLRNWIERGTTASLNLNGSLRKANFSRFLIFLRYFY